MINVVAVSRVKKESVAEYKEIARELVAETRKESGCISYSLFEDQSDGASLAFLESWESQAHLDAHMQSAHFKRILPALDALKEPGGGVTLYKLCE
ncbi:MAG: antibiotic biosynthesis monooxygenase [Defluviitaleaceae bacterium]|nr:antibiotic biosynthesis monooxygenase [Defluviitaleaceae bacterium]